MKTMKTTFLFAAMTTLAGANAIHAASGTIPGAQFGRLADFATAQTAGWTAPRADWHGMVTLAELDLQEQQEDDDGPGHDAGDDNGDDGSGHDAGDDNGDDGSGHDAGDDNGDDDGEDHGDDSGDDHGDDGHGDDGHGDDGDGESGDGDGDGESGDD